jgi:hypothetical protein
MTRAPHFLARLLLVCVAALIFRGQDAKAQKHISNESLCD